MSAAKGTRVANTPARAASAVRWSKANKLALGRAAGVLRGPQRGRTEAGRANQDGQPGEHDHGMRRRSKGALKRGEQGGHRREALARIEGEPAVDEICSSAAGTAAPAGGIADLALGHQVGERQQRGRVEGRLVVERLIEADAEA